MMLDLVAFWAFLGLLLWLSLLLITEWVPLHLLAFCPHPCGMGNMGSGETGGMKKNTFDSNERASVVCN